MSEDDKQQYYDKQKSFENTYQNKESIYEGNSLQKSKTSFYDINTLTKKTLNQGRFPANTILTYDETNKDEVIGGFPYTNGEIGRAGRKSGGEYDASSYKVGVVTDYGFKDSGSAARYFYCAKASKKDRDEGLNEFELKQKVFNGKSNHSSTDMKDVEQRFTTEGRNIHPTVKPVELMQYLVRLVTPKGGIILDPFMGSGSTGKATMYENKERRAKYKFIGIELSSEYAKIAEARIGYAIEDYYDYSSENATMENIQNNIGKKVKTSDKVLLW